MRANPLVRNFLTLGFRYVHIVADTGIIFGAFYALENAETRNVSNNMCIDHQQSETE